MTDTNTDPNYQDILNKYSKDLADNPDSEIPQNPPEPETATLTEVESTPVDEPVDTLANHTENPRSTHCRESTRQSALRPTIHLYRSPTRYPIYHPTYYQQPCN